MAPEVLGNRYEIGRPIGRGAMTRVLEAWDRHGHRRVALKVLVDRLAADEAFLERLEREARTAASLSHRNIAAVHAVGADTRTRFVVSELVEGPSLPDMLADRGPLPPVGRPGSPPACAPPWPRRMRAAWSMATSPRPTSCWPSTAELR